ncbi:DUF3800 domain-containing protein [Dyella acidiphila]|uniref:DUF3800 domain-containing protein n=1 Tax=Dyella acidiphila TaxID=2775866 RepID=A0ABR9GEB6_9GAMM|nr:DUF3800 domain-containing protein [Dyella acidiphila]MBE1162339.1 DUF3800 domain-containing protein [Dyella acidiphila]
MHLCYIDESGTSAVPGNSSHFVLAGLAIPIDKWKYADTQIQAIQIAHRLPSAELHTAWILRPYLEQTRIPNFEQLNDAERKNAVRRERNAHLLKLQRARNAKAYKQTKKNYEKTDAYIHLTNVERRAFVLAVAEEVSKWDFARLFCECVDKLYTDPAKTGRSIDEQAFEQVVSRYESYLAARSKRTKVQEYGLIVHDNNETVAKRHTEMMRYFHAQGTLWTRITNIIETPLFVDSQLTNMVQLADLCSYGIRRYIENNEADIFDRIYKRADRSLGKVHSVRHYTNLACKCTMCEKHRKQPRRYTVKSIVGGAKPVTK